MKTREEYIALITSHAEELKKNFDITSIRLFGSVARNEHHEDSDVDIYVEMKKGRTFHYVQKSFYRIPCKSCNNS